MRITTAAVIVATAVAGLAGPAFAQARLSDAQFVKVARCAGLAGEDAAKFDALVKANKRGRADFVLDRAMDAKSAAVREARGAREGGKAEIAAELAGICATLAG